MRGKFFGDSDKGVSELKDIVLLQGTLTERDGSVQLTSLH